MKTIFILQDTVFSLDINSGYYKVICKDNEIVLICSDNSEITLFDFGKNENKENNALVSFLIREIAKEINKRIASGTEVISLFGCICAVGSEIISCLNIGNCPETMTPIYTAEDITDIWCSQIRSGQSPSIPTPAKITDLQYFQNRCESSKILLDLILHSKSITIE